MRSALGGIAQGWPPIAATRPTVTHPVLYGEVTYTSAAASVPIETTFVTAKRAVRRVLPARNSLLCQAFMRSHPASPNTSIATIHAKNPRKRSSLDGSSHRCNPIEKASAPAAALMTAVHSARERWSEAVDSTVRGSSCTVGRSESLLAGMNVMMSNPSTEKNQPIPTPRSGPRPFRSVQRAQTKITTTSRSPTSKRRMNSQSTTILHRPYPPRRPHMRTRGYV
jgi:hypothetical protein